MADDRANREHQNSESANKDTLTNRQGHPITNNQNLRTVGNRGPATLENYDFVEKSATLIESGFLSVSSMRAGPALTATLKRTARPGTNMYQNILAQNYFRRKENAPPSLSVFHRLSTGVILQKPFVTRAALP